MSHLERKSKSSDGNDVLGYQSYAIDATDISLSGKKGTILRAHTVYSLSKKAHFASRVADIHTSETVKLHFVKSGSLYSADRAYGKTPQMEYVMARGAEFVFRFSPSQVKLFKNSECTEKIDFRSYLKGDSVSSIHCFFKGKSGVRKIRSIISPIPDEKAKNAIAKAKRKSVKSQHKLSKDTLNYAKWLFLAMSSPDNFCTEDIISAYRERCRLSYISSVQRVF